MPMRRPHWDGLGRAQNDESRVRRALARNGSALCCPCGGSRRYKRLDDRLVRWGMVRSCGVLSFFGFQWEFRRMNKLFAKEVSSLRLSAFKTSVPLRVWSPLVRRRFAPEEERGTCYGPPRTFQNQKTTLHVWQAHGSQGVTPAPPKSSYEPLMFMEPVRYSECPLVHAKPCSNNAGSGTSSEAQRGWLLGLLEEKLEAWLRCHESYGACGSCCLQV